jgi:SAM-dependent methyltransferase
MSDPKERSKENRPRGSGEPLTTLFGFKRDGSAGAPLAVLAGVFVASSSTLMFEISLTRIFSFVVSYHFVFLIVSLAVLGLGIGGLISYSLKEHLSDKGKGGRWLVLFAALFALSQTASTIGLLFASPNVILLYVALAMVPFVAAGMLLSSVFLRFSAISHRIYFADLGGAAVGSLLVVPLLQQLGAANTGLLLGAYASAIPVLFAWRAYGRKYHLLALLPLLVLLGLFAFNLAGGRLEQVMLASKGSVMGGEKNIFKALADGGELVYSEEGAYARTDVVEFKDADFKSVFTDGGALSKMPRFDGDLVDSASLAGEIGFFPFFVGPKKRVLIMGSGGGKEVLYSLLAGSQEITAVEINPATVRAVHKFAEYNGGLYDFKNVRSVVNEGRNFIEGDKQKYDLIYLPMVFSDAAGTVGYSLAESYVFTEEALKEYLGHLTPDGKIAFLLHDFDELTKVFTTGVSVLKSQGLSEKEATRHMLALGDEHASIYDLDLLHSPLLILKKSQFSKAESESWLKTALGTGKRPLYVPYLFEKLYAPLASGKSDVQEFISTLQRINYNARPATDDSPFFYNKGGVIPGALQSLLLLVGFATFVFLFISRSKGGGSERTLWSHYLLYFAFLGAGFMLIEVSLIQKFILFLGFPTLTFSVILFSLFLSGGLGALVSENWLAASPGRRAALAALGVASLAIIYSFALPRIFELFWSYGIRARSLLTMGLVSPLGFLMGIPFPTGLKMVKKNLAEAVPWMWAANGITSVLGSVAAVVIAMVWGFRWALVAGSLSYLWIFVSLSKESLPLARWSLMEKIKAGSWLLP